MTIEAGIENPGVYINSLNDTYPASGDTMTEGDNHIRGLKNTIQNTFPNVAGVVNSTHTELNYVDVVAIGTVEASKAVVVDANLDALGFRKITGTTSTGYTVSFTYTGTTDNDTAIRAVVTGAAGVTNALNALTASAAGRAVLGQATSATGINYGGYFSSASSSGFGVRAITSVQGGIPLQGDAADFADGNAAAGLYKGSFRILFNPRASNAGYANPIVQDNDQVIDVIGAAGAIDTGVLTLAPNATDAVGIRISSVTDTVTISGTVAITTANITNLKPSVTAGAIVIKRVRGASPYNIGETAFPAATFYMFLEAVVGNLYNLYLGTALATGTIRVYYTTNAVTSTITGRILVNTTATGFSNAAAGVVPSFTDVSVVAGDVIQLQAYYTTAGTHTIYSISFGADDQVVAVA